MLCRALFALALAPALGFVPSAPRGARSSRSLMMSVDDGPEALRQKVGEALAADGKPAPRTAADAKEVDQNALGVFSDAASGALFAALHAFDDDGIEDSSKNLRVLWSRALLHRAGKIVDPLAYELLPPSTRDVVRLLPTTGPLVEFQEFISSRTAFIDRALDAFLAAPSVAAASAAADAADASAAAAGATPAGAAQAQAGASAAPRPQVVLFGAGYDTRSLRYYGQGAQFFEVDLPSVVAGKRRLHKRWRDQLQPGAELPTCVGFDLNGYLDGASVLDALKSAGLRADAPTLFVWEAVLFYVDPDAVTALTADIAAFGAANPAGAAVCYTDSLKPHVPRSFTHEARAWFESDGFELVSHGARWGGAVHFALAATGGPGDAGRENAAPGSLAEELLPAYGGERPVASYTPTYTRGNDETMAKPSYDDTWYAVAYSWQVDDAKPYPTRLWGEPLVLYRDGDGELTCVEDRCPHRSAPLSMGEMEDGELRCMYHGWKFGAEGACTDVPTDRALRGGGAARGCSASTRAVVEHEGLVWVWQGENVLTADPRRLPRMREGESTLPVDTVLDYNVDWCYIVENNLDSPHLFWLHDGSVPPVASLKFDQEHIGGMKLKAFRDAVGFGHLGETAGGKPKIVRFDPPNVVRHAGVSGFQEEFHIVPIAPGRTRVLLRQHLPKGPILTTLSGLPGFVPFLEGLVRLWNAHIGLEDYSVMQGQAHNIDDLGAARIEKGALGDDIIARFYDWRLKADAATAAGDPFFTKWAPQRAAVAGAAEKAAAAAPWRAAPAAATTGREAAMAGSAPRAYSVVDDARRTDDGSRVIGTYGIKQSYLQVHPAADYPPVNYKDYKALLAWDRAVKAVPSLLGAPVEALKSVFHGDAKNGNRPTGVGRFLAAVGGCGYLAGPAFVKRFEAFALEVAAADLAASATDGAAADSIGAQALQIAHAAMGTILGGNIG